VVEDGTSVDEGCIFHEVVDFVLEGITFRMLGYRDGIAKKKIHSPVHEA
jgi:hypothetical protein